MKTYIITWVQDGIPYERLPFKKHEALVVYIALLVNKDISSVEIHEFTDGRQKNITKEINKFIEWKGEII